MPMANTVALSFSLLKYEINQINQLNEEQIKSAKKVFYLQNCSDLKKEDAYAYVDDFANVVNHEYMSMVGKMAVSYFKNNDGTKEYNNAALKEIMEYMETHDVKESAYYKKGRLRGNQTIN